MVKDLCIFLQALTEWHLPLNSRPNLMKDLFKKALKVYDWLEGDSILMNCFLNLVQVVNAMEIGKSCVLEEVQGEPLIKIILKRTMAISKQPPTETSIALMKNGLQTLKTASFFVEVRLILKNSKLFEMLEFLHPQIHRTRKTSWDDVTAEWLKFFEFLSRLDDAECLPR